MSDNGMAEEVRRRLNYDPETGAFTWRQLKRGPKAGKVAGGKDNQGYERIGLSIGSSVRSYKAHRLAWLYVHGEWPAGEIDHIDGNRSNNAISNLRLATTRQNQMNKMVKPSRSGYRGVHKQYQKWRASIRINGVRTYLGVFETPEKASAAYAAAAAKHHGEFACSRTSPSPPAAYRSHSSRRMTHKER